MLLLSQDDKNISIEAQTLDSVSFCGGFERNGKYFIFMLRHLMI